MKFKLLITLLLITNLVYGQDISIGIFNNKQIKKVFLETKSGKYIVKSAKKRLYKLKNERSLILKSTKLGISVSHAKKDYGLHDEIFIIGRKAVFFKRIFISKEKRSNVINMKLIDPKLKTRSYAGDLSVDLKKNNLRMINKPPFQEYLAGVVEAESGIKAEFEYYKNQAVICRTYALKTWDKHKAEGFNLCDSVHCQAYKGKVTSNEKIAQVIQISGFSGLKNNTLLLEFKQDLKEELTDIMIGCKMAEIVSFNLLILRTSGHNFGYKSSLDVWITDKDYNNANLMILLAYIIKGYKEWHQTQLKIYVAFRKEEMKDEYNALTKVINDGRLPISKQNIIPLPYKDKLENLIHAKSQFSDLVIIGFKRECIANNGESIFNNFPKIRDILFVNAKEEIAIY